MFATLFPVVAVNSFMFDNIFVVWTGFSSYHIDIGGPKNQSSGNKSSKMQPIQTKVSIYAQVKGRQRSWNFVCNQPKLWQNG